MIERQTLDGRNATVAYLKDDFTPTEFAEATLLKVIFDDGEILFLRPALDKAKKFDADEPRDETGKWTKGYSPGVKAFGVEAAKAKKLEWRKSTPDSIEALMAAAKIDQNVLAAVSAEVAVEVDHGTSFTNPGPKSEKRMREKVSVDKKRPQEINDAVRGGFLVESPQLADKIVADLAKQFELADERWAKNEAGYFDRKVMVRFGDGAVGEIQMWPPGMLEAKDGGGTLLYDQYRVLPKDSPKKGLLLAQMQSLYANVKADLPKSWDGLFD